MALPPSANHLIEAALAEDLGRAGDLTTRAFLSPKDRVRAFVVAKQPGVLCGTSLAARVFERLGGRCRVLVKDGRAVRPGQKVLEVRGGPGVLTAERVALNFLQRLSGVATLARQYARLAPGRVYDTRKTTPGWRELEKYAVACGGGRNHRMGLYDAAMVKDNHWAVLGQDEGRLRKGVARFRKLYPGRELELEAETPSQLELALSVGADTILLDNQSLSQLRKEIALIRRRSKAKVEVSGGVNLGNVAAIARLKPDRISIGRLTHSAPALDLSLDVP